LRLPGIYLRVMRSGELREDKTCVIIERTTSEPFRQNETIIRSPWEAIFALTL
jgi:MOSC domain-containing protein YiiM